MIIGKQKSWIVVLISVLLKKKQEGNTEATKILYTFFKKAHLNKTFFEKVEEKYWKTFIITHH